MNKQKELADEKTYIEFIKNKVNCNKEYDNYLSKLYKKYFNENKNFKIKLDQKFIDQFKNISNNFSVIEIQRYLNFLLSQDYNSNYLKSSEIKYIKNNKQYMCIYDIKNNFTLSLNHPYIIQHNNEYILHKSISHKITIEQLVFKPESKEEISKFLNLIFKSNTNVRCESLKIERSINSCGIILFEGLNNLFNQYRNNDELEYVFNITIGNYDVILKTSSIDLYIYFLNNFIRIFCYRKYAKSSIIIFSTNISSNSSKITNIRNFLVELKKNSLINEIITYNRNSSNDIITCILDYHKFCKNNNIIEI